MNKKTIAPIEGDRSGIIVGAALVSSGQPGPDAAIVEKLDPAVSLRPTHGEMIEVLAVHYQVSEDTIINWLKGMDL